MEEINKKIEQIKIENTLNNVILEVTVPTGLENIAISEILANNVTKKKLICFVPGRIYLNIPIVYIYKIKSLRSIDNINLFVDLIKDLKFTGVKANDIEEVVDILDTIDMLSAIEKWAVLSNFTGNFIPTKKEHDIARAVQDNVFKQKKEDIRLDEKNTHNVIKYRVTCDRIGSNHSFSSNEAACHFGGIINDRYNWIVALSDWDLNIFLRIQENDVMVCFKITEKSLHRRSLIDLGPTSLRPTISYGMLSLAKLLPGEHVIDPLCGSGSIPIECMYAFPEVFVTCGDIHHRAVNRTLNNLNAQNTRLRKPDIFTWNATRLPFANHQIDAIVTDLPFGKRSGSKKNNISLYKNLFKEFSRVLQVGSGRVVILTKDSTNLYQAIQYQKLRTCWKVTKILNVNVGALKCTLIVAYLKKT